MYFQWTQFQWKKLGCDDLRWIDEETQQAQRGDRRMTRSSCRFFDLVWLVTDEQIIALVTSSAPDRSQRIREEICEEEKHIVP